MGEEKLNTMAGQHTCAKMATCLQPSDMSPCCVLDKRPNCYAIWSFHHDTSCKQALAQLVTFSLRWGRSSRYLYTYRKTYTHANSTSTLTTLYLLMGIGLPDLTPSLVVQFWLNYINGKHCFHFICTKPRGAISDVTRGWHSCVPRKTVIL